MSRYTAPTSKGTSSSSNTLPSPILPGYIRARKVPDFGNASTNCFDFEEAVSFLAAKAVPDEKGRKGLLVQGAYLMDPCQNGKSPLRTATLYSDGDPISTATMIGAYTANVHVTNSANVVNIDYGSYQAHTVSALNAAKVITIDCRRLQNLLAIHMVASALTATLLVEVSVDNSNFLQVDSIAAAAATDLQYTQTANVLNGATQAATSSGTGASTVKLNPLSFRYIRITAGAAGAGNTTTMDIALK